jgi:hypothetical protein
MLQPIHLDMMLILGIICLKNVQGIASRAHGAGCIDSDSYITIIIIALFCFLKNLVREKQILHIKFCNVTSKLCIVIKFVSVNLQTVFHTYYIGMFMITFGNKYHISSCSVS